MDVIKEFFRELFKIIAKSIWGYTVGIFAFTLIMVALNEMFKIFVNLGLIQFIVIATGIITVLGVVDYLKEWEIFEEISEFIESLFEE